MLSTYDAYDHRNRVDGFAAQLGDMDRHSRSLMVILEDHCSALLANERYSSTGFPLRFEGVGWEFDVERVDAGYRATFRRQDDRRHAEVVVPFRGRSGEVGIYGDADAADELLNVLYGISVSCIPPDARRRVAMSDPWL